MGWQTVSGYSNGDKVGQLNIPLFRRSHSFGSVDTLGRVREGVYVCVRTDIKTQSERERAREHPVLLLSVHANETAVHSRLLTFENKKVDANNRERNTLHTEGPVSPHKRIQIRAPTQTFGDQAFLQETFLVMVHVKPLM